MKKPTNQATAAACLLILATLLFWRANPALAEPADYPVPYRSITAQEQSTIERTAMIALRHISVARSRLHRGDLASARQEMTEAARLIDAVRDYLSPAAAKNLIEIARNHLEYETASKVAGDLSPIYGALERVSVYLPTDRAKAHLDAAKRLLEGNDKPGADRELALADDALIVEDIEPALNGAQQSLKKGGDYLDAGDAGQADGALQSAERRMTTLYTGMNSLLSQATRNLWLAFGNDTGAGKSAVGQYLGRARDDLQQAAVGGNSSGKAEAEKLSREVAALQQKAAGAATVAQSALKAVWQKCAALAERSSAYLSLGFSDTASALWQDNDLIEARMHLRFAQVYQMTTGEPDKGADELDAAHIYLDKAARNSQTAPAVQKQLRGLDSIVQALKKHPGKQNDTVLERYDRVLGELSTLIQKL